MKKILSIALLMLSSTGLANSPIKAQTMKLVHNEAKSLDLCRQLPKCSSLVRLYQAANGDLYLSDGTPQLALFPKSNGYKLKNHWDFSNYQHRAGNFAELEAEPYYSIAPALYPLAEGKWAIALEKVWSEMYSGGSRSASFADFLQINEDNSYQLALQAIYFYEGEMIRACFSEEDLKKLHQCHDTADTILKIRYQDVGKPYYQWHLTYTQTEQHSTDKKPRKLKEWTNTVMPFDKCNVQALCDDEKD